MCVCVCVCGGGDEYPISFINTPNIPIPHNIFLQISQNNSPSPNIPYPEINLTYPKINIEKMFQPFVRNVSVELTLIDVCTGFSINA